MADGEEERGSIHQTLIRQLHPATTIIYPAIYSPNVLQ